MASGKHTWTSRNGMSRILNLETLLTLIAILAAVVLLWQLMDPARSVVIMLIAGLIFTLSLVGVVRLITDPESIRARQTDEMLKLARQTLACLQGGLDGKSAMKICKLLLPASNAAGVIITDTERLIGFAGLEEEHYVNESALKLAGTFQTLEDGETRILRNRDELGLTREESKVGSAIIVPLRVGNRIAGTLGFHYRDGQHITETQISIAEGFSALLSTQLSAEALEEQTQLATSMKLKALQNQINPHFLFNTINTIASLIRTDPNKARNLLREFAVFYRRTLEDSTDLILLSREIEQVCRYFTFELARFGNERVQLVLDEGEGVEDMPVPPFLIQPLVENAVRHAMPAEGMLTVIISAEIQGDDLVIRVIDDGVGMTEEARKNILHPESSTGMGIAVKNVHDRMMGYFGPGTRMDVESKLGEGTTITLVLDTTTIRKPQ